MPPFQIQKPSGPYQIIKLNKRVKADYEKSKDKIKTSLINEKIKKLVDEIVKGTKTEIHEDKLKDIPFDDSKTSGDKKTDEKKSTDKNKSEDSNSKDSKK